MKRANAVLSTSRSWQARRWTSYDKSILTNEALLKQMESGLGTDQHGNPLHIDPDSKTVSTAAGELPISPVFDPAWIKSKRRVTKPAADAPWGRFRKKLTLNPYARALSMPLRKCNLTGVCLPRHFLQDFEVINHPKGGGRWFAPGPLAFENIQPKYWENDSSEIDPTNKNVDIKAADGPPLGETSSNNSSPQPVRPRAPLTSYTISKFDAYEPFTTRASLTGKILGPRRGSAMSTAARRAIFRNDMGSVILKMLRQSAVEALITRTNRTVPPLEKFVQPVAKWEDVGKVKRRGCVLWLGGEAAAAVPETTKEKDVTMLGPKDYATVDVPDVSYGGKMIVHNLNWLLGEEGVAQLRKGAPEMWTGDHEIYVLKTWKSRSMGNLHLLLWRLHGFLAGLRDVEASS